MHIQNIYQQLADPKGSYAVMTAAQKVITEIVSRYIPDPERRKWLIGDWGLKGEHTNFLGSAINCYIKGQRRYSDEERLKKVWEFYTKPSQRDRCFVYHDVVTIDERAYETPARAIREIEYWMETNRDRIDEADFTALSRQLDIYAEAFARIENVMCDVESTLAELKTDQRPVQTHSLEPHLAS